MANIIYNFNFSDFPSGSIAPGKLYDQMNSTYTASRFDMSTDATAETVVFTFDDNFFVPTSSSISENVINSHDGKRWPNFTLKTLTGFDRITTTSRDWTPIKPMIIKPGAPGNFFVIFDVNARHTTDDTKTEYAIFYNDTMLSGSKKELEVASGLFSFLDTHVEAFSITGQAFISGAMPDCTISVRWKTTDPTAVILGRSMTVQRIN